MSNNINNIGSNQVIDGANKNMQNFVQELKIWNNKLEQLKQNRDIKDRENKKLKILGKKAVVLMNLGRYFEALEIYNYLLNQEIDCKTYIHRGICLCKLNRDEEAIINYNEGIQQYNDAFELYYNKGYVLKKLKRYEEAIESYDISLSFNQNDISSLHNKGNIYKILQQLDKAIEQYDEILKIDPQNTNALINKGLTLKQLKRDSEANTCFKKALELDSNSQKVIYRETNQCTLCDSNLSCNLI
ncbi:hypothetical protein ABPG72_011487 [Tetrahymena utriculariae]